MTYPMAAAQRYKKHEATRFTPHLTAFDFADGCRVGVKEVNLQTEDGTIGAVELAL